MTVKEYLLERMKKGTIHLTLLDPDKQPVEDAANIARKAEEAGTDAIMIGGSTDVTQDNLSATASAIKKACGLPTIYFPSGANAISEKCDAIFFMSMVNSTSIDWVIGEQVKGSLITKKLGLEPISMGYIIVEPGMKVGEVGKARPVKRDNIKEAMAYALACEYLGMNFVYLEAGSGADRPVPPEMITAVKQILSVPLIVGGGIRTPEAAEAARIAGADAVVTGTFVERCSDNCELMKVIKASKG
ncbi:MAG: geranylgeranylglyceryl/heptaprenylglyceryl phosphate synthase [Methanomassiliicoccaceae archaeon]|nr:geranylgeranylglyceryl/heptaprenylglyceryl phosphate synthase [Methanomassiliicoccaceae archaeon]